MIFDSVYVSSSHKVCMCLNVVITFYVQTNSNSNLPQMVIPWREPLEEMFETFRQASLLN